MTEMGLDQSSKIFVYISLCLKTYKRRAMWEAKQCTAAAMHGGRARKTNLQPFMRCGETGLDQNDQNDRSEARGHVCLSSKIATSSLSRGGCGQQKQQRLPPWEMWAEIHNPYRHHHGHGRGVGSQRRIVILPPPWEIWAQNHYRSTPYRK